MQENSVTQFGVHYMLDGYGAPESVLKDKDALSAVLKKLPSEVGMYPISEPTVVEVGPNNKKDPGGVSGFVLVAESHISFHTFPKRGFVTIDVYTCRDDLDADALTKKFVEAFQLQTYDQHELKPRGVNYPADDIF